MPSFSDFTWENFPDYDVTPEELQFPVELQEDDPFQSFNPEIIAQQTSSEEPDLPGAGDSYQGTDPTAFSEQDGTIDEQEASAPDAQTLGQSDDPEAQEAVGDEAEGDDEDDTSDPSLVDSTNSIYDLLYKGKYQEQGIDAQETTVVDHDYIDAQERYEATYNYPNKEATKEEIDPYESMLDFYEWASRGRDEWVLDIILERDDLLLELIDIHLDSLLDDTANPFVGNALKDILEDEYTIDIGASIINRFDNFAFDLEDVELDGEDNDDLGDGFTTPSLLTEMADIIGGVDQDTFLTYFQWLHQEEI